MFSGLLYIFSTALFISGGKMKKISKIKASLLSLIIATTALSPSYAQEETDNKDSIVDFENVDQSLYLEEDEVIDDKKIDNDNFNKEPIVSRAIKEDPYEIYTDYSAIDRSTMRKFFPNVFFRSVSSFNADVASNPLYDLRDEGRVTSVKDQGPNGSCWAFATYGSAESVLMPYERMDFSEKHMRNTHGFDWGPSEGGTRTVSTAYLARRSGPVLEKDDPYDIYGTNSPENLPVAKELTRAIFIPDRRDSNDNQLLKKMIMENGGVYSAVMGGDEHLNKTTMAHNYQGSAAPNHAITIVGWDDNYSRKNFKITPPGDGAWICKNSWGTGWGKQGGYYYVSYYDKNIGSQNSQYILEDIKENEKIWQYDKLGMTSQVGLGEESYYANVFGPTEEDIYLRNVGLWTSANNCEYEVFINTNVDQNGGLAHKESIAYGTMEYAGYEKVRVDDTFIPKGSKFAVIVRMKTPGYRYPIPIERPIKGFSSKVDASSGQSFVSKDGEKWTDLTDQIKNANVSLKAFTVSKDHIDDDSNIENKITNIKLKEKEKLMKIGAEEKIKIDIEPQDSNPKDIRWESSDRTVCRVDSKGNIKAVGYGECVISARAKSSSKVFDTMRVKVDEADAEFKANIITDKMNYLQGEKLAVNVSMRDQDQNQIANKDLTCEIVTSHNQKFNYKLKTNLTGEANFNVRLDNNAAIGKYKLNIYYKDKLIGINTFNVESKDFTPSIENPLFVTNTLEREAIRPKDDLRLVSTVTDKYKEIKRYAKVNMTLISPSNKETKRLIYTDRNGQAIFDIDGEDLSEEGNYKIRIDASLSGFDDFTETLDLKVDSNTPLMEKLDLDIKMDKNEFMLGKDKVDASFLVSHNNEAIRDANVRVSLTDSNQKSYDLDLKTDENGRANFSMDLTAANITGVYKLEATAYKEGYYDTSKDTEFFVKKDGKFLNISFDSAKKDYKLNESAYIKIQVRNENNEPKRNASVEVTITDPNQKETTMRKVTDYQGYVFIYLTPKSNTSKGEYTIKAYTSAYNYPSTSSTYKLRFGDDEIDYRQLKLDIKNKKEEYYEDEKAKIFFKSLDEYGNPVGNSEIGVSVKTADGNILIDKTSTDDKAEGSWEFKPDLKAGTYTISLKANKSNFKSETQSISFKVKEREKLDRIKADINFDKNIYEEAGKVPVAIKIKDENDKILPDATINIKITDRKEKKEVKLVTDKEGKARFDLDLNTRGKYELDFAISKDGYENLSQRELIFLTSHKIPKTEKKAYEKIKAKDLKDFLDKEKVLVIDTRDSSSYEEASIESSINIPYKDKDLDKFLDYLNKQSKILLVGDRHDMDGLLEKVKEKGFEEVYEIEEGIDEYLKISGLSDYKTCDINVNIPNNRVRRKDIIEVNVEIKDRDSKKGLSNRNIKYTLTDPFGRKVSYNRQTDKYGRHLLRIGTNDRTSLGKYKIKVQLLDTDYKNPYTTRDYEIIDQNTPRDLQMKADIKTDKNIYELGDRVNVVISAKDLNDSLIDKVSARASLVNQNDEVMDEIEEMSDDKGNIKLSFNTSDRYALGKYKIKIYLNREGFSEYKKELDIQIGDPKETDEEEKPDDKDDEKPKDSDDSKEDDKKDEEKPINPIDVEVKEQNFPLSFDGAEALDFFTATDDLTRINVKNKYAYNYSNFVLYNTDNKAMKIKDIIDGKRPSIFLMGDRLDSTSRAMFENSSLINDEAFNFINVVTNGSVRDLEEISKGKVYRDNFYRGNSINGQFRSNKNQVVILDKNGAMINVFPYKSNYELLKRFNMSNGYYASKDDYKLLGEENFPEEYPMSLDQRNDRDDYEGVDENELRYNGNYGHDFSKIDLLKGDNSRINIRLIGENKTKILLIGDYRKEETIKMWENANYIKDGKFDLINVSFLGSQAAINREKERFGSLWNVKDEIYMSPAFNLAFNTQKPSIVAIDKNGRLLFSKSYETNEDIKYVIDRTVDTFAVEETVTDFYREIEDLDILEEVDDREEDPNKIYPMTLEQRDERGDYRIFEPNEKEISKKYYGKDMNMYLMGDMDGEYSYIKDFLSSDINVFLVGSPNDNRSRIMWKNSYYLDRETINLVKISNYGGLDDLDTMFESYDMNDVADNFYFGGEKFDFDKELSSPYVLVADKEGRLLFAMSYRSNEDVGNLVNRSLRTKYSSGKQEENFPQIGDLKISTDNRDHEPTYVESTEIEGAFPLTYEQRLHRGDYDGLRDSEKLANKRYYGRDIKNINLLGLDNKYSRISAIQDDNLTLLMLGDYKEESTRDMWLDTKDLVSDDLSIKLINTIGSTRLLAESIEENELDIDEIYTNGNSIFYLNTRRNNTIVAIDSEGKVVFIKDYDDLDDIKYVLDRCIDTKYTRDIVSTQIPDLFDVSFE